MAQVHVDQTNKSSVARVHRHLPAADVPKLLEGRLWRPIANPAIDWPLGLCDYRSVTKNDPFPVALIYPDYEGETLGIKYNPSHKWKYLHGMTPDEVVLIKWHVLVLPHFPSVPTVLTHFHLPVLIPNRMVVSRCSHHTRDSATPARLKGRLLDSRLSFVLSSSTINLKFVYFEIIDTIIFSCFLPLDSTL